MVREKRFWTRPPNRLGGKREVAGSANKKNACHQASCILYLLAFLPPPVPRNRWIIAPADYLMRYPETNALILALLLDIDSIVSWLSTCQWPNIIVLISPSRAIGLYFAVGSLFCFHALMQVN